MGNKTFAYTYEFLRGVVKTRQDIGDLEDHSYREMFDHLDTAEKCEVPASYVAKRLKRLGWINPVVDKHGEVSARDEDT